MGTTGSSIAAPQSSDWERLGQRCACRGETHDRPLQQSGTLAQYLVQFSGPHRTVCFCIYSWQGSSMPCLCNESRQPIRLLLLFKEGLGKFMDTRLQPDYCGRERSPKSSRRRACADQPCALQEGEAVLVAGAVDDAVHLQRLPACKQGLPLAGQPCHPRQPVQVPPWLLNLRSWPGPRRLVDGVCHSGNQARDLVTCQQPGRLPQARLLCLDSLL